MIVGSLLAATALASAPLAAQGVSIGPMAGVSFTEITFDVEGLDGVDTEGSTGFAVGGFVEFEFGSWFSLEPQVLYVGKGGDVNEGGEGLGLDVHYIQVPVLFKAEFNRAAGGIVPSIFAGPEFGFRVSCDASAFLAGEEIEGECEDDAIKSTDYGVVFGAGVEFGNFSLQGRYDLGLQNINDVEDIEGVEVEIRNRGLLFTLGYAFKL
ncbi:MAG TPA: porin family protein [Gemmatimonadales bacterium]|nr:porin family protein [Gemmatimonadales bacterium]